MIKFIHCGDIHLDATFAGLGKINDILKDRLLRANYDSFKRIIDLAISKKVNFVLISGDLFDSPQRSLESQIRCKKQFNRLEREGIRVFVVGGNHDPIRESFKVDWPDNTYFFSSQGETKSIVIGNKKIYIHGVSYRDEKAKNNLVHLLPAPERDGINIGLLHCEVGGSGKNYSPCSISDLKEKGYNYFALGHVHQGSILSKEPYIVYSGCHQGKNIKETGEKGCYLVSIDDNEHVESAFVGVNSVQWFNGDIEISTLKLDDLYLEFQKSISKIWDNLPCEGAVVRFNLIGKGPLHNLSELELDELLQEINEETMDASKFVWVESIQNKGLPDYDIDKIVHENDFLTSVLSVSDSLTFSDLEILNKVKLGKIAAELDKDQILNNAKDKLIQLLLEGDIGAD